MCYTGECYFEVCGGEFAGDCIIVNHGAFVEKYGECACCVGGMPDDKESERYIKENKERLDAIFESWLRDRWCS